ncbi:MAG TPA: CPXCG motif-containing cysteine-rich protein [Vicinamibacteria bacterium]|jgi:hypothetical protein|nr:CPXCG motif-containing cysteine-rich protein [Vicinamibacteria bacterium]
MKRDATPEPCLDVPAWRLYLARMVEETIVECPSCGEPVPLDVDTSVAEQSYYEDCPVCCRPMEVFVRSRPGQILSISVSAD